MAKGRPVSFISEHTAEYCLVHQFVNALMSSFQRVVPFYFWASREGNSMSHNCGPTECIRLVSFYPRRPKILDCGDSSVMVKFNRELFRCASWARGRGIPVFAGVPVVRGIQDLTLDSTCAWFKVLPGSRHVSDVELSLDVDSPTRSPLEVSPYLKGPIRIEEIPPIVRDETVLVSWHDAIETLRFIRRQTYADRASRGVFHYLGGYKPVYMMLIDRA